MSKKVEQKSNSLIKYFPFVNPKWRWLFSCILCASIFFNISLYFINKNQATTNDASSYPLLSKRIFNQNVNDLILNFIPLRKALKEYVGAQKEDIGVYFEYLPSGVSIGVNDRKEIKLASLSKVPLAMSILKKIEKKELSFDDTLVIKKENLDKGFGNLWKKGEGSTFTVRELLEYLLKDSDNTAYNVLFDALTAEEIMDVYDNLDVEVNLQEVLPIVSPKAYSSIFRSLYLSSYLSRENSSYLLDILTKTNFKDKIPAGMPADITVAHKIGVFNTLDSTEKVYTDCGIVYFPNRPFTLCIFVKNSEDSAKKHMAYISNIIYSYLLIIQTEVNN